MRLIHRLWKWSELSWESLEKSHSLLLENKPTRPDESLAAASRTIRRHERRKGGVNVQGGHRIRHNNNNTVSSVKYTKANIMSKLLLSQDSFIHTPTKGLHPISSNWKETNITWGLAQIFGWLLFDRAEWSYGMSDQKSDVFLDRQVSHQTRFRHGFRYTTGFHRRRWRVTGRVRSVSQTKLYRIAQTQHKTYRMNNTYLNLEEFFLWSNFLVFTSARPKD